MYEQLYHRTISRELPEPQQDPRGRVRRGGWQGADGHRRLHGWAGTRLARGWGPVGSGLGLGWRGSGPRRCRRARIDGRDASAWAARGRQEEPDRRLTPTAMGGGHKRDGRGRACGKQARPAPQGAKPVRPCRVSHAAAAWRKARSAGPQAAAAEITRSAGNIFAPCVISGSSTRKRALGGKIRAPCILNRPIAPGNGCMGRGCCHLDLKKHAFRADAARRRASLAHSAKKGCMRCDSCQPRARGRRNARGGTRAAARGGRDGSDARDGGRCGRDFPMATT